MKDLIIKSIKEAVNAYPEIIEHLDGYAAWLVMQEDLYLWQDKAIQRVKQGEPALCEHESKAIPSGVRDMVKQMLGYADCEDHIRIGFDDILAFVKKDDARARYEKIPPRHTKPWTYTAGKTDIDESDIDQAVKSWDEAMPGFEGLLNARVTRSDEDNA